MIATRILKIDLKIAEIIEVKVGTCDTKIIFLTLCNSKMSISKWPVPALTTIISAISKSNFKILVPIANFQVCWKKVRSSFVLAPEPEKIGKTKWILAYWTPCILKDCTKIRLDYEVLMFLHLTLHSFLNRRTKRWMIIYNLEEWNGVWKNNVRASSKEIQESNFLT